jgi:pSer/pThr/pTyr-binding forkhead associated (FHA) protein
MSNGSPFTQRCEVSAAAVNAVIGRGPVDLIIDSQAVHREHARLGGSADLLTISDLGSPRGTWINRVPCLKGEIMFITPEDTIFLGDVSFQVALRPRQPGTSTAGKAATEMKP